MNNISIAGAIIGTAFTIIAFFVGRYWQTLDRWKKRDNEVLEKIGEICSKPVDFIRHTAFGSGFRFDPLEDLFGLPDACQRPEFRFLDKVLEEKKTKLLNRIDIIRNSIMIGKC